MAGYFTMILKDTIFETGAFGVPSKSQDPTNLNQVGPASTQWQLPNGHTQSLHWKLGQQTPSAGTLLAYLETTA